MYHPVGDKTPNLVLSPKRALFLPARRQRIHSTTDVVEPAVHIVIQNIPRLKLRQ